MCQDNKCGPFSWGGCCQSDNCCWLDSTWWYFASQITITIKSWCKILFTSTYESASDAFPQTSNTFSIRSRPIVSGKCSQRTTSNGYRCNKWTPKLENEGVLPRQIRSILAQLKAAWFSFLNCKGERIVPGISNSCPYRIQSFHGLVHLFNCSNRPRIHVILKRIIFYKTQKFPQKKKNNR